MLSDQPQGVDQGPGLAHPVPDQVLQDHVQALHDLVQVLLGHDQPQEADQGPALAHVSPARAQDLQDHARVQLDLVRARGRNLDQDHVQGQGQSLDPSLGQNLDPGPDPGQGTYLIIVLFLSL